MHTECLPSKPHTNVSSHWTSHTHGSPVLRLSAALQASVTSLEEVHQELATAYSNGVVQGFKKEFLGSTFCKATLQVLYKEVLYHCFVDPSGKKIP